MWRERDSLFHCFVFCSTAKEVWKEAENVIFNITGEAIKLSEKTIIIGLSDDVKTHSKDVIKLVNRICLIGKFTISKFRYDKIGKISILFERELSKRLGINN